MFGALDNAPHEIVLDPASGHRYQRAYAHALGEAALVDQVDELYRPLFDALSERLSIPYSVEMYSRQQEDEHFRRTWLRAHRRIDAARWWLDPAHGSPHVRVPCPQPGCGWAEKHAERTRVLLGDDYAVVYAVCLHHGPYEVVIAPGSGGYLDLATLYRNLVKELAASTDRERLSVMVKGATGCSVRLSSTMRSLRSGSSARSSPRGCSARKSSRTPAPSCPSPSSERVRRCCPRLGPVDARHQDVAWLVARIRRPAAGGGCGVPQRPSALLPLVLG
ncbi:hypothetical protein ACFQ51_52560 [Streptomyces kaempferi]